MLPCVELQRVVMEEQTSLARMALDVARATSLLELDDALLLWQAFKVSARCDYRLPGLGMHACRPP